MDFLPRLHPNSQYLWVDNGSNKLILVNKKIFLLKEIEADKSKQYIHTEFTGDGRYAFLSIYDKNGSLKVMDTKSLKVIKSYKADVPVGKYNFICKNRRFYPMLFGTEIVNEKFRGKEPKEIFKLLLESGGLFSELELKSIMAYIKYKEKK